MGRNVALKGPPDLTMMSKEERKAGAFADLLSGASVTAVAARWGIHRNTVARWRAADPELSSSHFREDVQEDLSKLVVKHLQQQFTAQEAILAQANDAEWLSKQSARDLAVLFGVISDKQVRILEAATPTYSSVEEETIS